MGRPSRRERLAERAQQAEVKKGEALTLAPALKDELIKQRLELLDVLFAAGLDVDAARKKLPHDFERELQQMKLGQVARHLRARSPAGPAPTMAQPASRTQRRSTSGGGRTW